jgi:hypothetical protein
LIVTKIISGGQSGVDRAALDVAISLSIPIGGWCPRGRLAEEGVIPNCYPLIETDTDGYSERTFFNVRDSDGTLILTKSKPTGGTRRTLGYSHKLGRPCLVVRLDRKQRPLDVASWIKGHAIEILNVAGPRESGFPGIYAEASDFLAKVFKNISA